MRAISTHWENQGYLHTFGPSVIRRHTLSLDASEMTGSFNRTPADLVASDDNLWQTAILFDEGRDTITLIAHAAPSLNNIAADESRQIYAGDLRGTDPLEPIGLSVSGGIMVLQPFLVTYGSQGNVEWSNANEPRNFSTEGESAGGGDDVTGSKIVRGLPIRNRAGLLWSLDTLTLMSFVGGAAVFSFQEISKNVSVLSANGIVEYDGLFFWPGIDRFFMYSGVVRELPNPYSLRWFYENINMDRRQTVWGMPVPEFGEIWWFFPYQAATEPDRAIIYNLRENCWYDTQMARTAGTPAKVLRYPLMAETGANNSAIVYKHEKGADAVEGAATTKIAAHCETGPLGLPQRGQDRWSYVDQMELDMAQTGDMTVTVTGREFPRSADVSKDFQVTPTETKVDASEQRRFQRFRFASDVVGGDFKMGTHLVRWQPGDRR